jgi:hypothetical protein
MHGSQGAQESVEDFFADVGTEVTPIALEQAVDCQVWRITAS